MAGTQRIVAAVFALLVGVKIYKIFLRAYLTPLRKVPGPWYAKFTNLVLKFHVIYGDRTDYIHDLHSTHGPFVRISPTEVAVNHVESAKEIHRVNSAYSKSVWYETMRTSGPNGPLGIFATIDNKEHAGRRKMLSRGFAKATLRDQWQSTVLDKVSKAIGRIKEECITKGSSDMLRWWFSLATDVSAHVMFGESFNTLESGEKAEYVQAMERTILGVAIYAELRPIWMVGRWIPLQSFRLIFLSAEYLQEKGKAAWAHAKANPGHSNVFDTVVANAEKGDPLMTEEQGYTEAGNLILAGTDTTANTLTYMLWAIMTHPDVRKALEEEIASYQGPLDDAKLETLPVLDACLLESLRLYCAAPASEPRIVPAGGSTLGGFYLPGGTTVSTQPWSLHRRPELFPDPEKFDISRWMEPGKMSDAARAAYMPWGGGSRICIGMHLARMELRLATVLFFRELKGVRLAPSTTPESMRVENRLVITPVSYKCEVML